jgi:hypothetical protein
MTWSVLSSASSVKLQKRLISTEPYSVVHRSASPATVPELRHSPTVGQLHAESVADPEFTLESNNEMNLTPRKPGDFPRVTKEQVGKIYEYSNPLDALDKELEYVGKWLLALIVFVLVVVVGAVIWRMFK